MWIFFAILSALFAGITSILAKIGIKETDSTLATAIRTVVVLVFSWLIVWMTGSQVALSTISPKTWLFLILSGLATGASWLCYFKALQLGDVNKVVPVDKSSTVLTLLAAVMLFHEPLSIFKIVAIILITIGTFLMIQKQDTTAQSSSKNWLLFALLSAIFASLTTILGKIGINDINSDLGTAIRTIVVLFASWIMVALSSNKKSILQINKKDLLFIILSGLATGISWLCYYRALKDGITTTVVSMDKLSIIVTIMFSYFILKEKITKKMAVALAFIIIGTFFTLL